MKNKINLAINGGKPVRKSPWTWKSSIGEEEKQAVIEVIESGRLSVFRGGPKVRAFEDAFSRYSGAKCGVATTSGTTALHTAVSALDIRAGDEVLVPPLTFVSTASVVLQQNAKPVFVDIDPVTYCMNPDDIEAKITKNTKAIIPVHIFGHPANMPEIVRIADKYGLYVIADAAQAHGARINDRPLGEFGHVSCYSFFQTKNMTTGEGGMVITNNPDLATKLRLKREHGSPVNDITWYIYDELGFNYSMTEMQAAVGLAQLQKLSGYNESRRSNAAQYRERLKDTGLILPGIAKGVYHVFHNFPVLLPAETVVPRSDFFKAVIAEGVPCDVCYPVPLYRTRLFASNASDVHCPVSEYVSNRIFTLFTDPVLSHQDINDIADAVIKVASFYLG